MMPRAGSVMGPEPLFHGGTVVQPFWKATQNVPPVSPLGGFPKGLRDVHAIIGGYLGQVRTVDYRGGGVWVYGSVAELSGGSWVWGESMWVSGLSGEPLGDLRGGKL